jgi:DNA repair ATPase RecN
MSTLQKTKPHWFSHLQRPAPIPPPPPGDNPIETALSDYKTIRDNYVNVAGQLTEAYDLLRELAHQNEALEATIKEDRTYYQGEIDRLRQERDLLSVFSVSIRTRLSTIVEVIHAAEREATESAVSALTKRQNAADEPELALEQSVRPVKPYTADSVQDIADELAKIGGGGNHTDYAPAGRKPTNSL